MKKLFVCLLFISLCTCLWACDEKKEEMANPENWDRIAQATATMEQYYNCTTGADVKNVYQSGADQETLNMIADGLAQYKQAFQTQEMSGPYVREITFIENRNGCDIFIVAPGFSVLEDGEEREFLPIFTRQPIGMYMVTAGQLHAPSIMPLVIEDGRYVIANIETEKWMSMLERYTVCDCMMLPVTVLGDACTTCGGSGVATQQSNSEGCTTCGGTGFDIGSASGTEGILNVSGFPDCPDCISGMEAMQVLCTDCEGMGAKVVSQESCTECDGKGYEMNK